MGPKKKPSASTETSSTDSSSSSDSTDSGSNSGSDSSSSSDSETDSSQDEKKESAKKDGSPTKASNKQVKSPADSSQKEKDMNKNRKNVFETGSEGEEKIGKKVTPKLSAKAQPQRKQTSDKQVKKDSASSTNGSDSEASKDQSQSSKSNSPKSNEPQKSDTVGIRKSQRTKASQRRSKHILGGASDSETDGDEKARKLLFGKKSGKKGGKIEIEEESHTPIPQEDRKCPVIGCDSTGHISGSTDKHFTPQACPLYHNMTTQDTLLLLEERVSRDAVRAGVNLGLMGHRSPRTSNSMQQKQYHLEVKDARSKLSLKKEIPGHFAVQPSQGEPGEDDYIIDPEREPNLTNLTSEYDLKLFREAQAAAGEQLENELKALPPSRGVKCIEMGRFEMNVWYQSPYPDEYIRLPKLYICEFCLKYMKCRTVLRRHMSKCVWRHPPGDEIYRKDKISVWEVNGETHKPYCQNLCLLAKFFLDHKTLYFEVEPFLFYIMTVADSEGCHPVGYFSKEKNSFLNYNVSCILTLPPYQRQGYGRLLIDFSYLLTRAEGKIGSPEKPLSDLGLISYRAYWKDVLLEKLCSHQGREISIKDLSQELGIHSYDIVSTLQAMGMMKYWKGRHIILKKLNVLEEFQERAKKRGKDFRHTDFACLRWRPFQPNQDSA
ncbi:histone acetyltransferase KAT7-like [Artemia franciscana]|uniref:Histone acetyltransferase n=1 Tax=Artemia franciscana TaxID=6661 RepID=A0AA88IB87_ARTSF|nr:hypothetical protein QYM36_001895 [Artemia franciscana]